MKLLSIISDLASQGLAADEVGLLQSVGNTPLVEIKRIFSFDRVRLFAKLEAFNPGGSVKMRPAYYMVRKGEESGELVSGKTIIDSTSGNTGIAYALIGAAKGYKVLLAMPANATIERKKILKSYGAELLLTDPLQGSDGAIRAIQDLYRKSPEEYFYPDQYSNEFNWQSHYDSTAVEIYEQTQGQVTHFVAGLGTSGTFMGVTRRLKEWDSEIRAISFMPDSPFHGLEGMKHMPTSIVPKIYDSLLADENLEIATEDAQKMVIRLVREEGIFAGLSSGAALVASMKIAENLDKGTVVTVFPDGGDKYLSEEFWNIK